MSNHQTLHMLRDCCYVRDEAVHTLASTEMHSMQLIIGVRSAPKYYELEQCFNAMTDSQLKEEVERMLDGCPSDCQED
jgi:hypothetical protein